MDSVTGADITCIFMHYIEVTHDSLGEVVIGGPGSNAIDLLQIYEEIGGGQHWVDLYAVDHIFNLGGYTWTSPGAYPQDQEFSIRIAFLTSTYLMPPPIQFSVLSNIDNLVLQWKADMATGSNESLSDFLRRNY